MKPDSPRIRSLLRQANRTAAAGKRAAAQQLYEQIISEAPRTVDAWLGLAEVTSDPEERVAAYEQVLELNPENDVARQALASQDGTGGAAPAGRPAPSEEAPVDGETSFEDTRAWLEEATARKPVEKEERAAPAERPLPGDEQPPTTASPQPELISGEEERELLDTGELLTCYRHPDRETGLRCYTCNRPICIECAIRTPVGYRCPICVRELESTYYAATIVDYLIVGVVSLVLGLLAGAIVPRFGFFIIFIAPAAGTIIGRIAFRASRRRRGRWLPHLVAAMVALGGLLPTGLPILMALLAGSINLGSLGILRLLWPAVYVFLATGAAYYQVR